MIINYARLCTLLLFCALSGCGGGSSSQPESNGTDSANNESPDTFTPTTPSELIANALSGSSIGLSWQDGAQQYYVYRNNIKIGETDTSFYIDEGLASDTQYSYSVSSIENNTESGTANASAKTLKNSNNDALNNGAVTDILNDRLINFSDCNINSNRETALDIADADLDACLGAILTHNEMATNLEDMRAFAARVRKEQSHSKVKLGMRLFHNKSLSANNDTACSSCHHPALGCGGDDLSMPIGVNALNPALLGPGRSDGENDIPLVPRNSPATCNTALWTRGLFWDNRVAIAGRGVSTSSEDVDQLVSNALQENTLALLMAQAHFPVTAPPEMGDVGDFGYDETIDEDLTEFRETVLASKITQDSWGPMFIEAFGDDQINFSRIAEAIASYESVQLFIDNPFFDYVDGQLNALTDNQKRGAITFMASNAGCTFCHSGAFFSTQAQLPGNYPQIGIGTAEDGSGADEGAVGLTGPGAFRAPTLLNVAITGPWGHNGQFSTLKRNVEHYTDHASSIQRYFDNNEMCELDQFKDLDNCASSLAPNGLSLSQSILEGNQEFSNNLSDAEIDLIVEFLESLTDPDAANVTSNAIQSLIPPRDGGPDGHQLDAVDINGNPL